MHEHVTAPPPRTLFSFQRRFSYIDSTCLQTRTLVISRPRAFPSLTMPQDSPLSITASVTGILTFIVAIILGLYARALSLGKFIRIDYEILDEFIAVLGNLKETKMLEERLRASQILQASESPYTRFTESGMVLDMYRLDLKSLLTLFQLLNHSRVRRSAEWESKRGNVRQQSRKVEGLKSKIHYTQILGLSK